MKRSALPASLLALAFALAGCAPGAQPGSSPDSPAGGSGMHTGHGSAPSSAPTAGDHSAADTMFAQMMIPHHQQAVEMSDAVLAKDGMDPRIIGLATGIKAAQGPEIEKMTGWLKAWGEPVAPGTAHHSMEGMMSGEDMAKLREAEGDAAAALFLTQMIAHHQGAVKMAEKEASEGSNPEAVDLARKIVEDQKAEIKTMEDMLPDYR
ncbi:DUF305 domain-containing protein [Zafaria cholistanensis]|uniref:DUF305 domain-containing protein n=1 Tax=Zafaria cholistanensis TaxID=1682741 RepID=A0A5A7NS83_9MICC|nr:DUF305 domain-containing protein [Zafaria cholistanensis]GER23685.1 DUF305 domain-containing protein [Zafaria cholistanensis]